jgi:hypothetical protein
MLTCFYLLDFKDNHLTLRILLVKIDDSYAQPSEETFEYPLVNNLKILQSLAREHAATVERILTNVK